MTSKAKMALSYRYSLEPQLNGWFLVRFPAIPEALTEDETEEEAIENARDCLLAAVEGYRRAGKSLLAGDADDTFARRIDLPWHAEVN